MISRNSTEERKTRSPRPVTLAALVVYVALVVPAAISNVERVNPDGVCYIRLARYVAEGRAWDSAKGRAWGAPGTVPLGRAQEIWYDWKYGTT